MNHDVLRVRVEQAVANLRLASSDAFERNLPFVGTRCRALATEAEALLRSAPDTTVAPDRTPAPVVHNGLWPRS
jgi:hypothetical protein